MLGSVLLPPHLVVPLIRLVVLAPIGLSVLVPPPPVVPVPSQATQAAPVPACHAPLGSSSTSAWASTALASLSIQQDAAAALPSKQRLYLRLVGNPHGRGWREGESMHFPSNITIGARHLSSSSSSAGGSKNLALASGPLSSGLASFACP